MTGLRFAMLTTFYPPHNFGGDGIAVQRLARGLARRGHHVTVVHDVDAYNALRIGPEPAASVEPEGVDVIRLRSGIGPLSPLLTQQTGRPIVNRERIRAILRDRRIDVTVFHNVSLLGGPGLLREGTGIRLYEAHEHWLVCPSHVLWRHGREPCPSRECVRCVLHYRRPPQLWRYTGLLQRELRHVDAFIAKSEFSRQKHREFGFRRDMEVIPYFLPDHASPQVAAGKGVDAGTAEAMVPAGHSEPESTDAGRASGSSAGDVHGAGYSAGEGRVSGNSAGEGRASGNSAGEGRASGNSAAPAGPADARAARRADRPYFLFVGRLERIKGLDDVIPAFRQFAEADLVIAGDGEHASVLRGLADGAENVRFLGRIAPERLAELYRGAVALIVPSVCYETFGIILIEAFQQGTPVIARRIGPFPEIVNAAEAGLLFETADEMLAAMRRVISEPGLRVQLAEAGRRAYKERWSEAVVVPQYLDLVRRVAERKGESRMVETLLTASVA
jgi:glycosyltransferase involved in cell wall biosynthesis